MKTIDLYEGPVLHKFEVATDIANNYSKGNDAWGQPFEPNQPKAYHTAIKCQPSHPELPEYCWRVTNKFDPRVSK